jgi:ABC-type bacteriocin/lantibiotic exporter with double-glycine peptidase domain
MIIGKIGSGKSSLLYSILGEMRVENPKTTKVFINSSIAYCGQTPWLMNGTVKENILLNQEMNEEQFIFAVKYSALDADIENWTLGIEHIIGDDGSSISGGQRTRIALARCLYQK